jgi:penicillin-insensitive murein endopeptidase
MHAVPPVPLASQLLLLLATVLAPDTAGDGVSDRGEAAASVVLLPPVIVDLSRGAAEAARERSLTVSVGSPQRGRLVNGKLLEESSLIRFKVSTPPEERYATAEMVSLLEQAARHVDGKFPGAPLRMGDLSRASGGRMPPHSSHRSGRDADLLWYALYGDGSVAVVDGFVGFRRNGVGFDRQGRRYRFDDARNWELIAFLLTNDIIEVEYIFVSSGLERRLIDRARSVDADPELIQHARRVLRQSGGRHHDHLHLRIACPESDRPLCRL